ncbi:MAG: efflux RND transporter periplasmic adaptor subunit [Pseudomonadota bacterium]
MRRDLSFAAIGVLIGALGAVVVFQTILAPGQDTPVDAIDETSPTARMFPDNAIVVTSQEVELTPPRSRIQSIGSAKASQLVHLNVDFSGTIETIHAEPNKLVRANDPIVTFERRTQAILLDSAKAELDQERANFERLKTLSDQNSASVSRAQIDDSSAALAVAGARLDEAQYEFDRRVIRAPFSGMINLNDLTIGSYIPQGSQIVTLVDTSSLFVEFSVPEVSLAKIESGVPVRLATPALRGRFFDGSIVAFDSTIDEDLRNVRVRAQVDNPDNILIPGMTFRVSVQAREEPLPRIPSVSVLWDRGGAYVWRLTPDNQPERVDVILRNRVRDEVWVEGELNEGDRVVRDGAFKVGQGSLIAIDVETAGPSTPGG